MQISSSEWWPGGDPVLVAPPPTRSIIKTQRSVFFKNVAYILVYHIDKTTASDVVMNVLHGTHTKQRHLIGLFFKSHLSFSHLLFSLPPSLPPSLLASLP